MIGTHENQIHRISLVDAVAQTKAVATAIEEKDFEKAMSFRDPEFIEALEGFVAVSALDQDKKLPKEKVSCSHSKMGNFCSLSFTEDARGNHAVGHYPIE